MDEQQLKKETRYFKAFGNPLRLRILKFIGNNEKCQCEIIPVIKKPQSTVSEHLEILVQNGILEKRQERVKIFFRIKDDRAFRIMELVSAAVSSKAELAKKASTSKNS